MTVRATDASNNPDVPCSRRQSSPRAAPCRASTTHPLRQPGCRSQALPVPLVRRLLQSLPFQRGAGWAADPHSRTGSGSRRGRGAAAESDAKPERAAPAAVVRDRPCRPRNPVLCPDGRLSGKKLRRLFFRKPHYSIMFMCSVSTLYYLQHEILVHWNHNWHFALLLF